MDAYCVHCGRSTAEDHTACHSPRAAIDPPRYCAQCARRMVVQVTPMGWTATCSRHGQLSSASATD